MDEVVKVLLSNDGKILASISDYFINIWNFF